MALWIIQIGTVNWFKPRSLMSSSLIWATIKDLYYVADISNILKCCNI